jgi:nitrile hydratase
VLAEWGTQIPDDVEIRVVDSTADYRWMVLPMRPKGTEGWSVEKLASIVTRDALVGVALPRVV